jgi:alkylation response protein AidB-like acyl-CoA dehydrogenase
MSARIDWEYVDHVRKVVEEEDFFGRAAVYDREARYPRENIDALSAIGVPSMHISGKYGGPDHTVATQTKVVETIAYGDPSTAACMNMHWVVADIIAKHAGDNEHMAALLRDCVDRQSMFAGGASIPADEIDAAKVGARFRRVDGGWRGSGRVGFATNSEGATYVGTVAVVVDEDDQPVGRRILVLKPPVDTPGIELKHDWSAMGLRATATNTIEIRDAFVDERYAFEVDLDELKPGLRDQDERTGSSGYTVRSGRSQITKGGMWLGHCKRMLDFMEEFLHKRKGTTGVNVKGADMSSRARIPWAQSTFGRMRHWVLSGELVLYSTIEQISDESMDAVERADRMLLAMYHMRRMCEEVSRESFRLAGAHGIVTARPYERMYRDLMGYIATAYKAPEMEEHLGRAGLGLSFALNASGG